MELEKDKFNLYKSSILLEDVDIRNVLVSNNFLVVKKRP